MVTELEPKPDAVDLLSLEYMQQFFAWHKVDETELSKARKLVAAGIDLRANTGKVKLEYSSTTLMAINELTAEGVYYSAKYQGLNLPDEIGFIDDGDGNPSDVRSNYTLARSDVTNKFPNGYIHFSAFHLALLANKIEGIASGYQASPGFDTPSHEMRHIFQKLHSSEQMAQDRLSNKWNETASEREARAFGNNFALAHQLHIRKAQLGNLSRFGIGNTIIFEASLL